MIVIHDHFEIWPFSSRIDAFQAKPVQFEIVISDDDNRSLPENLTNGGSEHLVTFLPGILFRERASGLDQLRFVLGQCGADFLLELFRIRSSRRWRRSNLLRVFLAGRYRSRF